MIEMVNDNCHMIVKVRQQRNLYMLFFSTKKLQDETKERKFNGRRKQKSLFLGPLVSEGKYRGFSAVCVDGTNSQNYANKLPAPPKARFRPSEKLSCGEPVKLDRDSYYYLCLCSHWYFSPASVGYGDCAMPPHGGKSAYDKNLHRFRQQCCVPCRSQFSAKLSVWPIPVPDWGKTAFLGRGRPWFVSMSPG
jgi:hypothetical protein